MATDVFVGRAAAVDDLLLGFPPIRPYRVEGCPDLSALAAVIDAPDRPLAGCARCGVAYGEHYERGAAGSGVRHRYVLPDAGQIWQRMQARRAAVLARQGAAL